MLIDLHVRAPVDESHPDVESLLKGGVKAGLDGLCLVGDGQAPPIDEARQCPDSDGLALFFGVELAVEDGHVLWIPADPAVFESDDWIEDVGSPASIQTVVAAVGNSKGILIAVHPYDRSREPLFRDAVYQLAELGAIEIANANLSQVPNNLAIEAAVKMGKSSVGGTGPMRGPASIGRCCTVFLDDVTDQAELVSAIARGDVWAVELLDRLGNGGSQGRGGNRGRGRNRRPRQG